MNEKAKQELIDRLDEFEEETMEDNCAIFFYVSEDNFVKSIDFRYYNPLRCTEDDYISFDWFYPNEINLDLSNKESCAYFLSKLQKELYSAIHNPNYTRVEMKRDWREKYGISQTLATKWATWFFKTWPKLYKLFEKWVNDYGAYSEMGTKTLHKMIISRRKQNEF